MSSLHGSSISDEDEVMQRSRFCEVEAHPTELAIVVKFGTRKEQKM